MLSPESGSFEPNAESQASPLLLPQFAGAKLISDENIGFSPFIEVAGTPICSDPTKKGLSIDQQDRMHSFEMLAGRCYEFREKKVGTIAVTNEKGAYAYKQIPITPVIVDVWNRTLFNMLIDLMEDPLMSAKAKEILAKLDGPRRKEIKELNALWSAGDKSWNEETRVLNAMWDNGTNG